MTVGVDPRRFSKRVARRPVARRCVDPQHLPSERGETLRGRHRVSVAGRYPQVALGPETHPASCVLEPGPDGHPPHQRVSNPRGLSVVGVDGPGDHLHLVWLVGLGVGLAGVEPPVGGEVGICHDRHEPGRSTHEQVAEVGGDNLDRAVGEAAAQHAADLGEQHRPVGCEGEIPRVLRPVTISTTVMSGAASRPPT